MIPLHDDNPTTLTPFVTVGLIVACVAVFLWQVTLPPGDFEVAVYAYGMIPAELLGQHGSPVELAAIPAMLSVLTSMFLHGGWMHLIGNMLYLWIFGNNVEDAMGHGRFVVFYLLCGIAAALAQAFQDPNSAVPMIGASGAIGGVLGAYVLLYPRARVLVVVPLGFFFYRLRIPAMIVLGLWFGLQFVSTVLAGDQIGGVAYWAHIGGFVAGMVLILPFRKKGFPLFASARSAAVAPPGLRPALGPKDRRPKDRRPKALKSKDRRATVVPDRAGSQSRLPQSGRIWRRKGPWS